MTWLGMLLVVALVVVVAALSGIKPKGTRPVARTGLMTVARVVLVLLGAIVAYVVWMR